MFLYHLLFLRGPAYSNDPTRSIYSYQARQPPLLTSLTSIFGHDVDLVRIYLYIYIYYIYFIYVVVFPWFYLVLGQSLGFFTHNLWRIGLFSSICPEDADSLRYIYLSWLLNGFYNGVLLPGTVLNPLAAIPWIAELHVFTAGPVDQPLPVACQFYLWRH
jgi:hypothetical protein